MRIDGLHPNADGKARIDVWNSSGLGIIKGGALPKHIHIKPTTQDWLCSECECNCHYAIEEVHCQRNKPLNLPKDGVFTLPEVQDECYRCGSTPCKCGDEVQPTEVELREQLAVMGMPHDHVEGDILIDFIADREEAAYKRGVDYGRKYR